MEAATLERSIAIDLMKNKDYMGARKKLLALEASNSSLGGLQYITELRTVCEIICTAEFQLPGSGINWYWILQTTKEADKSVIDFKYENLIRILEPIKGQFPGIEYALELIKKAYAVLSDERKRQEFDLRRTASLGPDSNDKVEKGAVSSFGSTFSSRKSMVHKENFAVGQIWAAYDQEKMPRNYARIHSIENVYKKGTDSAEITLNVRWLRPAPVNVDEQKWHEVGLPVSCGYFFQDTSKIDKCSMMVGGRPVFSHLVSSFEKSTDDLVELYPKEGEVWAVYKDWQPYDWCSDPETRKGCKFQLVEILTSYSKQDGVEVAFLVKVAGFTSIFQRQENQGSHDFSYQIAATKSFMFSHNVPAFRFAAGEQMGLDSGMVFELDPFSIPEDVVVETVAARPLSEGRSSDASGTKHPIAKSPPMTLGPKPKILKTTKWTGEDFSSGQIWAIYDGPDAMPRRYVIVRRVVSGDEVCVTCLKPHPELADEINWVEQRLPFVCGSFETGRDTLNLEVSCFSHLMKCESSSDRHRIYPRKGEVWAMYKNWNSNWDRSNIINCQYRIVEILSDCLEDAEMRIASLVEVYGHKTFFHRQLYDGFELIRTVSMKELLSFSHKVPSFIVPGIEKYGVPDGSWHLEPDALPAVSTD